MDGEPEARGVLELESEPETLGRSGQAPARAGPERGRQCPTFVPSFGRWDKVWGKAKGFQRTGKENGAQGRNRTTDTAIFSRMLYQLSYLGTAARGEEVALIIGFVPPDKRVSPRVRRVYSSSPRSGRSGVSGVSTR